MTGPLDFLTTSRSGERAPPILGAPASFAAWAARASGVQVLPVITAAAPIAALRMMKDLRLRFERIADSAGNAGEGASFSVWAVFMFTFFFIFWSCYQ